MASLTDRLRKLFRRRQKTKTKEQPGNFDVPEIDRRPPAESYPPPEQQPPAEEPPPAAQELPAGENQQPFQVLATTDGAQESELSASAQARAGSEAATRTGQLQIALVNNTTSSNVYAYITGSAIDRGNALFLLSADGRTAIYPPSPGDTGTNIARDISIRLGPPGSTTRTVIPRIAGGRIWISIGRPLIFKVNPGPGLIEPSVFNQADPNIDTNFGFAEFTFNSAQVFANISYVDFISLPIALSLRDIRGNVQRVAGLERDGLNTIAAGLRAQTQRDGRRWSSLIVPRPDGGARPLRILSPNSGLLLNPTSFQNYWQPYVDRVWDEYRFKQLTVDTQASWGEVDGQVRANGLFEFGAGAGAFAKPSTRDVFSCSTGPFATGTNAVRNAIIPRLAAAVNRSTLLLSQETPNGTRPAQYYTTPVTNHYSRIVHEANINGKGYAFPYDDVTPDGGVPQEGAVFSFEPEVLTVAVGGR